MGACHEYASVKNLQYLIAMGIKKEKKIDFKELKQFSEQRYVLSRYIGRKHDLSNHLPVQF